MLQFLDAFFFHPIVAAAHATWVSDARVLHCSQSTHLIVIQRNALTLQSLNIATSITHKT